jgi:hypothetical protein
MSVASKGEWVGNVMGIGSINRFGHTTGVLDTIAGSLYELAEGATGGMVQSAPEADVAQGLILPKVPPQSFEL